MTGKPTYEELEQRVREMEKAETERKRAEEALRESEKRLQILVDSLGEGVILQDASERILLWNQTAAEIFSIDTGRVLGRAATQQHWNTIREDGSAFPAGEHPSIHTLATGETCTGVTMGIVREGKDTKWIKINTKPLFRSQGAKPYATIISFSDITELKRAEEALRHSEKFLRQVIEASPNCIFIKDWDGRYVLVNKTIAKLYGVSKEKMLGRTDFDLAGTGSLDPEEAEKFLVDDQDVISRKTLKRISEECLTRGDGTKNWFHTIKVPLSSDLMPNCMLGVATDITERKRAEEALRQSEEKYRRIYENSVVGFFQSTPDGRFLNVNPAFAKMLGYESPEELISCVSDIASQTYANPEGRSRYHDVLQSHGYVEDFELKGRCKDGSDVWVSDSSRAYFDENGKPVCYEGIVVDITERKRAEEKLRESEEKYRSLFDQSKEGIYLHDLEGRVLDVNEMACEQSGYSREEWLGLTVFDSHPSKSTINPPKDEILRIWSQWAPGQRSTVEAEHQRKDGTVYPVEVSTGSVRYGDATLMLAIVRDITERKLVEAERENLQTQLVQAQKMESVGRLAGGVAHDFNNMLSIIIGNTEMAMEDMAPNDPLHNNISEIFSAARRSADITRQLLAFARKQTIAPKVLDLNKTIERVLKMLRRLIGEDIDLAWLPEAKIWPVRMDPGQIDQILANLCVNARDAIADVGRITIETGTTAFDEAYCARHPGFVPGDFVLLAVSDDGCGMDRQTLDNLFEPFFTTKDMDKGTGLGLATVYGIVKQNDGFINVYSEPGQGTTFKIYLPRHQTGAQGKTRAQRTKPTTRSSETILLVEDEPSILRMTRMMLERMGYRVLAADTPGEAIALAREHLSACGDAQAGAGDIHLLMTDVVMPEMNGRDLAKNILSLYPHLKYLFMSGYTGDVITHHGVLDEGVQFIQKPFSKQDLAITVRAVLDEAKEATQQ